MSGIKERQKWLVLVSILMMLQVHQIRFSTAEHARVESLPGFHGPLPFILETGYIGVGEAEEVQLFHYFVKSQRDAKMDPLVLWLTGGPGCSSVSGLLFENGPLKFEEVEYNGSLPTLFLNPNAWTKVASMIYVDSPVGTGFSYATNPSSSHSSDTLQVHHLYQFLVKWLMEHQEFFSNSLYIGGDSYSGTTIPVLVKLISDANEGGIKPLINLKGYLLGNAGTDSVIEFNSRIPFAHGMALISDELYESLKKSCRGEYQNINPSNLACLNDMTTFNELIAGVFVGQVLEPSCVLVSPKPIHLTYKRRFISESSKKLDLNLPQPSIGCPTYSYVFFYRWFNDNNVKKALHIREGSIRKWTRCNHTLPYTENIGSTTEYHHYLSTKGYRSLIYNGDLDMIVPFLGTQAWIRSLNYSISDDWRQWRVSDQVAGYTRTYSNQMTFATIKGGGHEAPIYRPIECFMMFKRWISQEPL